MNIFKRGSARSSNEYGQEGSEPHHEHHQEHREQQQAAPAQSVSKTFDTYSFWVLLGMLFLLPVLFIPSINIPFQFTKTFIVFAGILIALFITLISRLKEGSVTLPHHYVLYGVWLLPLVYFISSLFSTNPKASFLGQALEVDTFAFITLMAVFVTLVTILFRRKEQALYAYLILFASFILLWIFQGSRLLFGPDFLSFSTLTLATSNVFGKWNDLSIFFGLATVMSLVTLASLQLSSLYKRILYVMLLISLFFLAVVNFAVTWIVVGLFALGFIIYGTSSQRFKWIRPGASSQGEGGEAGDMFKIGKTPLAAPIVVFIVSLLFVFGVPGLISSDSVGNLFSQKFGISQIEARPSWQSTINIGKNAYKDDLLLGSGPNTFVRQWVASRPVELNTSIFWNADFISGIGMIPTAFVTAGLIGGLAWLLLLGLYLYSGFRALVLYSAPNHYAYFITLSSFLAGLYLWILMIFYTPNVVLVTLTFFFTGIFLSSLRQNTTGKLDQKTFVFAGNPKIGFASVFTLTVLLLLTIVAAYTTIKMYASSVKFQSGVVALNVAGDIDRAQDLIAASIGFYETDRQYRLLADISSARVIALQSRTDLSEEELRTTFQTRLAQGIEAGQRATELDPTNYQNWLARGRVYQSVVPLGIQGAYENALSSFEEALKLNPNGPAIYLTLARLEVTHGDTLKARDHIADALRLKSNYTDAIFLLSQIEINEGNVDKAIESIQAAAVLTPNNPVIFFQLGLLKYHQNDNEGAVAAFERAVALSNDYANARYFLGLSYDRLGRNEDAIAQFERVQELNPDNEEVAQILENLRAGKAPFADKNPPPPAIPDELPVEESPGGEEVDPGVLDTEGNEADVSANENSESVGDALETSENEPSDTP